MVKPSSRAPEETGSPAAPAAGTSPAPLSGPAPASFELALGELEQIVQRMEGGALSLEQSLADYRRGAELVGWCRQALAGVQQQVRILDADLLRAFEIEPEGEA